VVPGSRIVNFLSVGLCVSVTIPKHQEEGNGIKIINKGSVWHCMRLVKEVCVCHGV
jgi:hypothetical protein